MQCLWSCLQATHKYEFTINGSISWIFRLGGLTGNDEKQDKKEMNSMVWITI